MNKDMILAGYTCTLSTYQPLSLNRVSDRRQQIHGKSTPKGLTKKIYDLNLEIKFSKILKKD